MRTTVVIPNYNGIEYLKACLNSLHKVEDIPYKIIVVDDGSSDESVQYVKDRYPDVSLIIHDTNKGFAASVNSGITASDTEYVLLLNNDTVIEEHFVDNMQKALDADDKIFSASAKMLKMNDPDMVDGAGDYYCALGWAYAHGKDKRAVTVSKPRKIFSSCAGAAIYRRELLIKLGLFDERHFAYLEDVDVGYRANIAGYYNVYVPEAVVLHAGSGSSGSRYNEFKVRLSSRNSTYLICKNMPLIQQLINLPFMIIGFGIKLLFFLSKGYGLIYLRGLFAGIKMGYDKEGRAKKVRFTPANIGNYIRIQLQLWLNILRRFM